MVLKANHRQRRKEKNTSLPKFLLETRPPLSAKVDILPIAAERIKHKLQDINSMSSRSYTLL